MPARNSIIKKTKDNNNFAVVDDATKLYKVMLKFCTNMPKRYTFFIGQDFFQNASKILGFTKAANSIYAKDNKSEAERRISYWKLARESCQVLSSKINCLVEASSGDIPGTLPGVSFNEISNIVDLLLKENNNLVGIIKNEMEKLEKMSSPNE